MRNVCAEETLKIMDYSNPSNLIVLENSKCHFQPEQKNSSSMSQLQKIHIRKFTGYGCSLEISTNVGYCWAYGHTKESGYSTYAMPQPIGAQECLRIVTVYTDSGVDIIVKVNAIIHTSSWENQTHSNKLLSAQIKQVNSTSRTRPISPYCGR